MVVGVVIVRERCVVMGVLVMEVVAEDVVHAGVSGDETGREQGDVEEGDTVEEVDVAPIQLRIGHRQDPEHQGGHGATGTTSTLGGHTQLDLRRLHAPVAKVLPSFTPVGAPSVVDPQGPDDLGDGTPNTLLRVGADLEE
ncbi:hypothetical protein NDU88_003620 [Pleurodeles waltl]|uniref:Uncharacterized protein n=1 Tax=Pleurodeles waltl TaxID=8319 RepID=A0AAV7V0K5_PLEWA|nr:hypothetical protein NDU88_003620 [Pleurodeles waltl]